MKLISNRPFLNKKGIEREQKNILLVIHACDGYRSDELNFMNEWKFELSDSVSSFCQY